MLGAHRWRCLAAMLAAALALAACGGATTSRSTGAPTTPHPGPSSNAPPSSRAIPIPAPSATGARADPAAVAVIQAWSSTLRSGDVRAAAGYFALPSEVINGGGGGAAVIEIRSLAQAESANATLPCGARFISADQRGRYVNALFRLTERRGPGAGCGAGVGLTARTNFLIARGQIVRWIRAPDDPGDNAGQAAPTPPSPSPVQPGRPVA